MLWASRSGKYAVGKYLVENTAASRCNGQVGVAMLDIPTLFIISTCVTAVLGLFMLFAWIQDRSIRALAWWGAAYLVGGLAAALWSMHDAISRAVTMSQRR